MKEKIQLVSRGVFEYENPNIEISEKEIELEVEFGSRYTGAIQLNSRNHIEIRAMVSHRISGCSVWSQRL